MDLYPDYDLFENAKRLKMFKKVIGSDKIFSMLQNGTAVQEIEKSWQAELDAFLKKRKKYLLY